jgi:predicted RNase H-like HicB family nuclease
MNYSITLVESEEGFAVWCEELPGCCSQGATREEAIQNIKDAIREYLEARAELPARFGTKVSREVITVSRPHQDPACREGIQTVSFAP